MLFDFNAEENQTSCIIFDLDAWFKMLSKDITLKNDIFLAYKNEDFD